MVIPFTQAIKIVDGQLPRDPDLLQRPEKAGVERKYMVEEITKKLPYRWFVCTESLSTGGTILRVCGF